MLAHKAEDEGIVCVEHLAGKGYKKFYSMIRNQLVFTILRCAHRLQLRPFCNLHSPRSRMGWQDRRRPQS